MVSKFKLNPGICIFIIMGTFSVQVSFAQNAVELTKKNIIKGSIATMGMINGMVSIDYERVFFQSDVLKLQGEATFGRYYQSSTVETFQSLPVFSSFTSGICFLIGRKSNFFEIDCGARYSFIGEKYELKINPILPVLNLGYRYQNNLGKGLVFRTFIGSVGIGVSIGKAF